MSEQCKEKTKFGCRFGTCLFEVILFGVKNAPSTFQGKTDTLLSILPLVKGYFDDVVIFSRTIEEHTEHICQVMLRVLEYGLRIKIQK